MSDAHLQLSAIPDTARLSVAHCPAKDEVTQ
jgi:hypothetical protein